MFLYHVLLLRLVKRHCALSGIAKLEIKPSWMEIFDSDPGKPRALIVNISHDDAYGMVGKPRQYNNGTIENNTHHLFQIRLAKYLNIAQCNTK